MDSDTKMRVVFAAVGMAFALGFFWGLAALIEAMRCTAGC